MANDEAKTPESGQEVTKEPPATKGKKPKTPKQGGGVPGWAVAVIIIVVIAVIAGIAVGVVMAMSGGGENQAPTITSLTANPPSITAGHLSTVTCVANDPDDDTLDYNWEYTGGELQGSGTTRTWIAPNVEGTFTVTVTVDDGNGGTDEDSVAIVVANAPTPTPTPTPTATVAPTPTATLPPSQGSIDIQSNPSGAAVYIDGVDTGMITPIVINHIPEGNHVVRLVYLHYEWRTESVPVFGGETTPINWLLDYSPTQSVTIQPDAAAGKDAFLSENSPSSNFGTNSEVAVGGAVIGKMYRSYIQFDLSSVPSSAVVIDAKLGLYYWGEAAGSVAGPIGVFRVVSSWDEATISWDNEPALASTVITTTTVLAVHTNAFVNWDIDDLVQAWISGSLANRGVALMDTDETTVEGYKRFYSSDHGTLAETPKLTIQYYDPAP